MVFNFASKTSHHHPPYLSQALSFADRSTFNFEFSLETNFLRLVQHQKSEGPETFVRIFNNVSSSQRRKMINDDDGLDQKSLEIYGLDIVRSL